MKLGWVSGNKKEQPQPKEALAPPLIKAIRPTSTEEFNKQVRDTTNALLDRYAISEMTENGKITKVIVIAGKDPQSKGEKREPIRFYDLKPLQEMGFEINDAEFITPLSAVYYQRTLNNAKGNWATIYESVLNSAAQNGELKTLTLVLK